MEHTDVTDAAALVGGDLHAFERVYRRHVGRVQALARWLLGSNDTDDVTQDVFLRLWNKRHLYDGRAAFSGWLGRLAVNVILAHRGRVRRIELREDTGPAAALNAAAAPMSPGAGLDATIDLEAAVPTLPDGAREIFVLFDVHGFTHDEIARSLGISVGTSRSQLHRARTLLRERLSARESSQ